MAGSIRPEQSSAAGYIAQSIFAALDCVSVVVAPGCITLRICTAAHGITVIVPVSGISQ